MIAATDSPYIKDLKYDNAEDFLKAISYNGELYSVFDKYFVFRGHSSSKYKLLPTALRDNHTFNMYNEKIDKEHLSDLLPFSNTEFGQIITEEKILSTFFKKCDDTQLYVPELSRLRNSFLYPFEPETLLRKEKWLPEEYYEIAALAQHHGLPTRLLDWTSDINVALYFASTSVIERELHPKERTYSEQMAFVRKCFDNHLKGQKEEEQIEDCIELWALDIRISYFNKELQCPLVIVRPRYYENDNMAAQKGLFTLWKVDKPIMQDDLKTTLKSLVDKTPLDQKISDYLIQKGTGKRYYLYHIEIPKTAASEIYEYVSNNHCDAAHLFPGYEGVVKCINENNNLERLKSKKNSK